MATAENIGVVASLDPAMQGTAPGASARPLARGDDVVADDLIRTTDTGRGQLLFLDQTSLSIAPRSEVVLDEFVYDPGSGAGSFAIRLIEGALRFIGGQTTENADGIITTPTATISIRGSSALVLQRGDTFQAVLLTGDQLCLVSASPSVCTSRQGGLITNEGYAGRVDPALLAELLAQIDGAAPGQLVSGGGDPFVSTAHPAWRGALSSRGATRDERGRRLFFADEANERLMGSRAAPVMQEDEEEEGE